MVRFKFTYTFFVTFGRHSCLNPLHVVAQSRAQLLEPRRAGGLASRNSEVLSLSPSLLPVLAARKCSAPNHVTLMLAFTSLSLPLQDDESSSEEEEDAEPPAESPVSCRAPCLLLLETYLGRTLVSFRYVVLMFRSSFSPVPFPSRARTSRLPTDVFCSETELLVRKWYFQGPQLFGTIVFGYRTV